MSTDDNSKQFTTQEQCSNGGKNRASQLSPERRREIALKASHARKCMQGIPKAKHYGKLMFGNIEIVCAVLEDGRSVITESSVFRLFGMKKGGGREERWGAKIPRFLSSNNLQEYIPEHFLTRGFSFDIILPSGGKGYAYEAEIVPEILTIYLNARRGNVLNEGQKLMAATAEIVIQGLAKTGIVALIHECTGYQQFRENDELQQLFSKFIAKELQPWTSRFPKDFFQNLKRIYRLQEMKRNPSFFGCLINRWIYKELSPEILDELKKLNPISDTGNRKHKHHQFLTPEIGCPALEKQIHKVTTLLSVSDSKDDFERLLEKSKS